MLLPRVVRRFPGNSCDGALNNANRNTQNCTTWRLTRVDRQMCCWTLFTDIDECADGLATCDDVSSDCINVPGGYHCQCRSGFRADELNKLQWNVAQSRCVDVDECSGWGAGHSCPSGTVCRNTIGSYKCVCNGTEAQTDCGTITSRTPRVPLQLFFLHFFMFIILQNTKKHCARFIGKMRPIVCALSRWTLSLGHL